MLIKDKIFAGSFLFLAKNLKPLSGLWSASLLVAGANFGAVLLIVSKAPVEVYAAYTVGQALLALAAAWTDGGLASTLNVLAAQPGDKKEVLEIYRAVGLKYSWRIVPFGYLATLGVAAVLLLFGGGMLGVKVEFYVLAGFALIGLIQSRTSFCAALLYATGEFKRYNLSQALPAIARLVLIGAAILFTNTLGLDLLLGLTLLTGLFGWAIAFYGLQQTRRRLPSSSLTEPPEEIEQRVKRFLKPSFYAVVIDSLGFNLNTLGASLFTTSVPIAAFGVFQRLNQIITMFAGPLIQYVTRKLRLVPASNERKQKELLYIFSFMLMYGLYGLLALVCYALAGAYLDHYSLKYPVEFAVFLVTNGLGYLTLVFNSVLVARGGANHRVAGTLLQLISLALLIFLLHPGNLLLIVSFHALSLLFTVIYYGYLFASRS